MPHEDDDIVLYKEEDTETYDESDDSEHDAADDAENSQQEMDEIANELPGEDYQPDDMIMPDDDILDGDMDESIDPFGDSDDTNSTDGEIGPEVDDSGSEIGTNQSRSMAVLGIILLTAVIFLYNMVFSEDPSQEKIVSKQEQENQKPLDSAEEITDDNNRPQFDVGRVEEPDLPNIDSIQADAPPPPPMSFDEDSIALPDTFFEEEEEDQALPDLPSPSLGNEPSIAPLQPNIAVPSLPGTAPVIAQSVAPPIAVALTPEQLMAQQRARRRGPLLTFGSEGLPNKEGGVIGEDGTITYEELAQTATQQSVVTKIGNTDFLIAQGKIIHVILETAINTDLSGTLRAIVSRDIYAESGRNILIPKGSRVIGEYKDDVEAGQKRVFITWGRLIMPNGLDIDLGSSNGIDRLGRAGVRGFVDNKFFEIFKNSILLSAITIGGSLALEKVRDTQSTTSSSTGNTDGSTTTSQTGTSTDLAILDSVDEISGISGSIAEGFLDADPTITVDQGTIINVFVNRDLVFPADAVQGGVTLIK